MQIVRRRCSDMQHANARGSASVPLPGRLIRSRLRLGLQSSVFGCGASVCSVVYPRNGQERAFPTSIRTRPPSSPGTCRDKIINPGANKAWPMQMHAPRSLPQHSGGMGVLTVLRRQMSIPSPRRPSLSERGAGHSRPSPAATARRLRATDSNVLQLVFIRPAVPAERHSVGARVAPLPLWR